MSNETDNQACEFQAEARGKRMGLVREFFDFLKHNKKWWLAPIIIIILLVGLLVVASGSLGPLIYALG